MPAMGMDKQDLQVYKNFVRCLPPLRHCEPIYILDIYMVHDVDLPPLRHAEPAIRFLLVAVVPPCSA